MGANDHRMAQTQPGLGGFMTPGEPAFSDSMQPPFARTQISDHTPERAFAEHGDAMSPGMLGAEQ